MMALSPLRSSPDGDNGLRLGINLLYLTPGEVGGTEVYARELLRALMALVPARQCTLFLRPCARDWGDHALEEARRVVVPGTDVHPAGRVVIEGALLAPLVRRSGVQVLHSLGYHGPWWGHVPSVVTVHDTNYADFLVRTWRGRLLGGAIPAAMRHAARILTVSTFACEAIARWHPWVRERLVVIPHGPGSVHVGGGWMPDTQHPYLLAFGARSVNKNLERLLEAWGRVAPEFPTWTLRVAGAVPEALRAQLQAVPRVVVEGVVTEARKDQVLRGASALVMPSLYEGFGLPALEAMAVGVPVIASSTTALGEVVGTGGMTCDPLDVAALAAAIRSVAGSSAVRQALSQRGLQRASAFSWERSARAHLEVYRAVAAAAR
jgi:glycosyltransferase involved in cell wall biosynthesis